MHQIEELRVVINTSRTTYILKRQTIVNERRNTIFYFSFKKVLALALGNWVAYVCIQKINKKG